MWRLTLTQMRLNAGRLLAAGTAVVLGTAFVTATLLAGDLLKEAMRNAVSASYRGADVVVSDGDVPRSMLTQVRRLPQLDGADVKYSVMVQLTAGDRSDSLIVNGLESNPALRTSTARTGRLPSNAAEIAVTPDAAQRLRLSVGDRVVVRTRSWPDGANRLVTHDSSATLVGLIDPASGFWQAPDGVAMPADLERWTVDQGGTTNISRLVAHAAPGTTPEQARAALAALPGWGEAEIRTGEQQIEDDTREMTEDVDVLAAGLMAFAGVALFVAGLVITNTFQVLVAQRTRALALLRCVGATRRQIRRSVLLEAALLGIAASLTGLLLGTALVTGAATGLSSMDLNLEVPSTVTPSLASVLFPLLVGVLVTVLAALAPAREATRVSPVAALRPLLPATLRNRRSILRILLAAGLTVGGAGLLALGVMISSAGHDVEGLLSAMAGGALSFLGVLLGGSLFIPALVGLIGRAVGRWGGVPARVAAANAVRNPRRTANTSAALLIGVTLVATMSTGAAVVTATLNRELDSTFPVDVIAGYEPGKASLEPGGEQPPVPAAVPPAVSGVPGVAETVLLAGGEVQLTGGTDKIGVLGDEQPAAGSARPPIWLSMQGVEPATAEAVLRAPAGTAGLAPGTVVVPKRLAVDTGVRSGDLVQLTAGGHQVRLRAVVTELHWGAAVVTPQDLRAVLPSAQPRALWLRLSPQADSKSTVRAMQEAVVDATGSQMSIPVTGAAVERAVYEQVIQTMLMIVTGLLAVAVVIALIGVANTLSLSVIERTRESAVLRALGLTRRQLRAMLAVEGTLIAGIGAVVGVGLGTVYGWAGAASVVGGAWQPALAWPVRDLLLLLIGGVLAGLAASLLPGRRAARTSPVEALAE